MKVKIDGNSIFVGQGGVAWREGQKTLLLQHGAGMDRTVWVLLARYFARHGYNVVTPDLPGHGASEGRPLESVEAQATFVGQLLDSLQQEHGLPQEPVIVGGHSMGALVALALAGQRPEQIEQLILFGAGYPMPVGQPLLDAAQANEQSAIDMIAIFSHCHSSQLGHNAVAGISALNAAMALLERAAPGVLYTDLAACNAYQGLANAAAAFGPGRTTLIVGDSDRMTPMKMSRQLIDEVGGELVVLRNCGHMLMTEQPELTLQAVRKILL